MELVFTSILVGLVPAFVAKDKGKRFIFWWLYGAVLFFIALPHALILPERTTDISAETGASQVSSQVVLPVSPASCRAVEKEVS